MLLLSGCSDPNSAANLQQVREFVRSTDMSSSGRPLEPLPEIRPYQPHIYSAQGLKDPFALAEFAKQVEPKLVDTGIRPDQDRPREELERYSLGSLEMVGTVQRDGLWGLIKAPDGTIHRVREGNHLGTDHGEIVNITERGIKLREIVSEDGQRWVERDNFLSLSE